MKFDGVRFSLEQIVYRKLKPDMPVQIVGILFRPNGHVYYVNDPEAEDMVCYECELQTEKGFVEVEAGKT